MRHISFFSGIGGFDLAADWMGWKNIAHCEIDKFCQRVLRYYWPNAKSHGDIKKTDFTQYMGTIDIVSGGFPCQPYSSAGKRLGKADDRHLWPEMLRAIREIQPRWVVGENVRVIVNWNGGMVFEEVQADLEAEGYEVLAFILPAAGVGAPHRRDRVWFVAYSDKGNDSRTARKDAGTGKEEQVQERDAIWKPCKPSDVWEITPYSDKVGTRFDAGGLLCEPCGLGEGQERGLRGLRPSAYAISVRQPAQEYWQTESRVYCQDCKGNDWDNFPTQSPICGGDDGLPSELDGITFPKWRNESIGAYGNAVVPQLVYRIFKAIQEIDDKINCK